MRSLKKVLALMLSLAMVFSMLTVTAFAEPEWTEVTTRAALRTAIAEAEDGVTKYIKLTARIGLTKDEQIAIPAGKDIVIDMNGHSIGLSNKTENKAPLTNNGILTLEDSASGGNVWGNSSGTVAYPIVNNGTLTIKDGVAVARYNGTVTNTEEDISKIGNLYATTVKNKECIKNTGILAIENAIICNGVTADGTITIQLGNFATNLSSYVKTGFEWQAGSTAFGCSYKSIKVSDSEALIGTTEYTTLADAFEAAENGDTILLNKDVTVSERIELADAAEDAKKTINFNMNGKKVTYTGERAGFILVRKYNTVNISGAGTVDIQAGDFFFTTNRYSKVNVEDGTFTGATRLSTTSYGSSTMNISGGIWSIDPSNQMSTSETSPTAYSGLADGYIAEPQGTTPETWLIKQAPSTSVTVDGKTTEYPSFDDAFMAAFKSKKAAVVTVLRDTTSAGNLDTTGVGESTAGVVLDLNGKTVSVSGTKFMKLYKAVLTITDNTEGGEGKLLGKASSIASDGFIYANSSNAVITVEGGTIEANGNKAILRCGGSNTSGIVVNGGKVINKNEGEPYTVVCATSSSYSPSVSINGGNFEGAMTVGSAGAFTISGGTFNFDPNELYDQGSVLINGDVVDNEDGTWSVVPQKTAKLFANGEEIGDYTIDQALNIGYQNYTDGDSITVSLFEDAVSGGNVDLSTKAVKEESGSWTYNAPDITLDLNNHALTVVGPQFVKLKAKFTIDDFSEEKEGYIEAVTDAPDANGIFYHNSGRDFIVNNGSISAYNLIEGQHLINASGFQTSIYINGGTLDAGENGGASIRTNNGGCVTTFNGGTILSPVKFDAGSGRATGGSFITDPQEWGITVEGLYIVVENEDTGYYDVIVDPDAENIVEYDGTEYQTVAGAVADILATPEKTGTINFITDAFIREGVINVDDPDANITFDLNGCFIQEDSLSQLFLLEKGNFTIKNGIIYAAGQIATSGHIRANNATLLVQDIVFDGDKISGEEVTNINKSNGGAFYIYGSDATFDNTTIKNCKVTDEATGKGNSGAMHIVKQSVAVVSNVRFTNGSMIENCQAASQGGAISVGSGCTFVLEDGCEISNCKSAMGGAIYIDISDDKNFPAVTDHLCGTAYINGTISNCTSTGDNTAPIASRGFVFVDGDLTTTGDVFQRESVAALDSGSLTLDGNLTYTLSMIVAKTTDEASKKVSFVVTLDGKEVPEEQLEISGNDITIKGIKASQMGAKITVQAQVNRLGEDVSISNAEETSIVDYCEKAFDPENEKLDTLLANLLNYGKEAQKFWSASCDEPVVIPACLQQYVTTTAPSGSVKAVTVVASQPDRYKIKSANLNLDERVAIVINVWEAPDKLCKVIVNDGNGSKEYSGTDLIATGTPYLYRIELDRLNPVQYNDTYTISLIGKDGQTIIHEVTYSVNSYCVSMPNDLTKAIYNYGVAAEGYVA